MFAVAREYNEEENVYEFTEEEIQEFNLRRKKRISRDSKTYSWEQAKKNVSKM